MARTLGTPLATPLILATLLCLVLLAACGGVRTEGLQLDSGERILQQVCTHCHDKERICAALGRDQAALGSTIKRMNLYGANLDAPQSQRVALWLADQAPGSRPTCAP